MLHPGQRGHLRFGTGGIVDRTLGKATGHVETLKETRCDVGHALGQDLRVDVDLVMVFGGILAGRLAEADGVFRLLSGNTEGDLHDQRH